MAISILRGLPSGSQRFFRTVVSLLAIVGLVLLPGIFNSGSIPVAKAGAISTVGWSLSSTTENATNVTYTHTFTTASSANQFSIELRSTPGVFQPMPDFSQVTIASGSTAGFIGLTPSVYWSGTSMIISLTTTTALTAGAKTIKFGGVTNPSQGGVFATNTSTKNNGTAADGTQFSSDPNGKLTIGTVKLSGTITDVLTGLGIAGLPVQVHPGPNSNTTGFWQTNTANDGTYSLAGLANGAFVFEMSPNIDPKSTNASTLTQYMRFDPVNVTISDTPQTINKALAKSQKMITGKVVYAGTSTNVVGAMVGGGSMGGGFAQTTTGTDGTFTLRIAATGPVFINVMPSTMNGGPQGQQSGASDFGSVSLQVYFNKSIATAETIDVGSVGVKKADATITGTIQNPDGTPAIGGAGLENFNDHSMTPVMLAGNGSFSALVVSGSTLRLQSFDPSGLYSMPNTQFKAKKGTNNIGIIKKINNDKTITITAKRTDGTERAIANANAMVFPKDPGPPYFAMTNSSGVATVKVPTGFEGRAGVMPGGSFGGGPKGGEGGPGGPKAYLFPQLFSVEQALADAGSDQNDVSQLIPTDGFKKVKAGDSITVKFSKADKAVSVKTVDTAGALITQGAFVDMTLPSGFHMGCPTAGGLGTCYAVAGKVTARVMFPPDSGYAGKAQDITVPTTGTVSLTVVQKTATITGQVQDGSNGNAVVKNAALQINVGAMASGSATDPSGFYMGKYNPSDGTYSIPIPPGVKVRLGVMVGDPGRGIAQNGYVPSVSADEFTVADNQSVTKNLTLAKVDATISGKVTDGSGNALEGVTVVANNTLATLMNNPGGGPQGPGDQPAFERANTALTDSSGNYSIPVAPDKYQVIAKTDGMFPTSQYQAQPASGETKTVNIQLAAADSTLKVEVNKSDGTDETGATAHFFDDNAKVNLNVTDGGTGDLDGTTNGIVEVKVPAGDINVVSGIDFPESGQSDESSIQKVKAQSNKTLSFTETTATQTGALQQPVSSEVSSSSAAAVALSDGNNVSIPQGGLNSTSSSDGSSSSSSNPVVTVTENKAELPETKSDSPIGTGLTVSAIDGSGNTITSLTGLATIEMKYTDADLKAAGITDETKLKAKYFDTSTGQWLSLSSSVVNTTTNVVTATTNHFTQFAIVATTDTTAPAAPTSVTASDAKTGGAVSLAWTNPTDTDFAKIRFYRSTTYGDTGSLATSTASATQTSFTDTGLTNGTTYYYTLRSVDTSGNESANTDQYSATPGNSGLPKTGTEVMSVGHLWETLILGLQQLHLF